jgi:hypothetical protein
VARSLAIATAIITALTVPVVVLADSRVDPQASSPAGAVYEIPLQTARDLGSPGGGGGAPTGGGSGGGGVLPTGSAIKSENGYGSSSQVPGLSALAAKQATHSAKAAKAGAAATGSAAGTAAAATASAKTAQAEAATASTPRIDAKRAADEAPSLTGTYGLVILIVLGGAAAGIAASLAARSSFGERSS